MALNKVLQCEVAMTFRQQNLVSQLEALIADCNLYVVSRRPIVEILAGSVKISRRGRMKGKYAVVRGGRRLVRRFQVQLDSGDLVWAEGQPRDYYQILDRSTRKPLVHGDPWGLLLLATSLSPELADHEVIYVGRAVSKENEGRNAITRILSHSTLQKIYADHSGLDFDVFVSPLRIGEAGSVAVLETMTDFSLDRHVPYLAGRIFSDSRSIHVENVHLAEAALISFFRPEYNVQHKDTFPRQKTQVSDLLARFRYSNLTVSVDDGGTSVRLWSPEREPSGFHGKVFRLNRPGDVEESDFEKSASKMENKFERYIQETKEEQDRRRIITLAMIPADLPSRLRVLPPLNDD